MFHSGFLRLFGDTVFIDKFYFFAVALLEIMAFLLIRRQSNWRFRRFMRFFLVVTHALIFMRWPVRRGAILSHFSDILLTHKQRLKG